MRYVIDSGASKLTVRAFAAGMLSSMGHNPTFAVRKFEGEVELDGNGGGPARSSSRWTRARSSCKVISTRATAGTSCTSCRNRFSRWRRTPGSSTTRPPGRTSVKPAGSNQFEVSLKGDLTLHGVTRPQPISTRVLLHGDMLRASGEVPIRQADFQLKPVTVAGSMMKVKDDVKLTFDIVARGKPA